MFIGSNFEITVLKVAAVNRLRNSPIDVNISHQYRKRWAIALKLQGKTYYSVNGQQILSDSLHPVLLPKGCSYTWTCTEPGDCLMIEFDALETQTDIFSFTVQDSSFIVNELLHIQKWLHIPTASARLECCTRLYNLLLQLIKTEEKEYIPLKKQQRIQPAMDYISDAYFDPTITNESLAQLCGISTVYFRKCFEAVYDMAPIRYLHNYRIEKAKDILSSDYVTISQVAQSVGYTSVYHFSKMFKTYTGNSPSQYAKSFHQRKP